MQAAPETKVAEKGGESSGSKPCMHSKPPLCSSEPRTDLVIMKTTVIAIGFPLPSETFILRHVNHFRADVVCQQFLPELLQDRNGIGEIACAPKPFSTGLRKSSIGNFLFKVYSSSRRLLRPASQFEWSKSMHRHWSSYLDRCQTDVVLAEFAPNALGSMQECLRRGIPIVVHFHGYDATALMRISAYRRALPELFKHAAAVICVSRFMRDVLLQASCPSDKLHVIPCGAPVREFAFSDQTKNQPCTFLAVSRLVEGKGPMVTLKAFRRAHSSRPGLRLIIAGDGPMRREINNYVRKHSLEQAVSLVGCVPNGDVRFLMATSSVFVQASLQDRHGWLEGWGVSLAEALASGLPAVVSRSGGMVDLVTDGYNGYLFEPGDWCAMADRMVQVADDPALRLRMGRAAREHVEKVGSTENCLRALESVLHSVVTGVHSSTVDHSR